MIRFALMRAKRSPHVIVAILVFSTILSAVLCSLNKNIEDEITAYEEAYTTISVKVQMCDLMGVEVDNLEAREYVYNVFLSDFEFGTFLKDIQFKYTIDSWRMDSMDMLIGEEVHPLSKLVGISSQQIDAELAQRADNVFAWFEGYDESILSGDELVCVIPERFLQGDGEPFFVEFAIVQKLGMLLSGEEYMINEKVKVVGTHKGQSDTVYFPFYPLNSLRKDVGMKGYFDAASAILVDNHKIDEFRNEMLEWFPEPNDTGEKTYWEGGHSGLNYYPVAMKIDDSKLHVASVAMENSIKINTMCAYIVLGLSAVAGFFVGFLAIRSRKREITLMRSLGNSGLSIFAGCCAEQLLCLIIGTAIGGAAFMWQPLEQIAMFMGIYFVGTIVSLVIFISRNLLQGQKEDE